MSRNTGYSPPSVSSICVSGAAAPISQAESVRRISRNSGTASTDISAENFLNFLVISSPNSVAPATNRAAGCARRNCNNSVSDAGLRNSSPGMP